MPPGKNFLGVLKQHWGARYEAGNAVKISSFTCYSPIILTKNEGCKVENKKQIKDISSYAVQWESAL